MGPEDPWNAIDRLGPEPEADEHTSWNDSDVRQHRVSISGLATPRLQIYVVGHTDAMVASVPQAEHLVPVDLRRLSVPDPYDTNSLAEGRFLLSREAAEADAEYVGMFSANWSIRFPDLASLEDLSMLRYVVRPDRVFAARPSRNWRDQL